MGVNAKALCFDALLLWRHLLVCCFCCIAAISAAHADDRKSAESTIIQLFLPEGGSQNALTPTERRILAKAVETYCQSARDLIPTLSPDEQAWLKVELGASNNRAIAAASSPTYARYALSEFYDACLSWARPLTKLPLEHNGNVRMWAGLVNVMIGTRASDYVKRLQNVSLPSDYINGADPIPGFVATCVLTRIIMKAP
jgi:hypothetical protein